MRIFVENDILKVEIDSFGAEVKSVLDKTNYREYMWYGNPKFWGRTSPVLFPFVGSLKNKTYSYAGREYHMGQHGFARDMEFTLDSREDKEVWFKLVSDNSTYEKYPFEFELKIGYILNDNQLTVKWQVTNTGDKRMYFSIGAHPAFLVPVHGENNKVGYKLRFEGTDRIIHHGNTLDTGLAIMEDKKLELTDGTVTIDEDFFDHCTYMIENNQTKCVGIEDAAGNKIVDVNFDTPLFAIWSPEKKNAPFICIEPWYGRCDAIDFEGSIEGRAFTNVLECNETFEGGYEITYYTI